MADCIFAFGQLLANKGLLDRSELAGAVEQATVQQSGMGGDVAARTYMARMLVEAFSMPLAGDRSGIRVVSVDGVPIEAGDSNAPPVGR